MVGFFFYISSNFRVNIREGKCAAVHGTAAVGCKGLGCTPCSVTSVIIQWLELEGTLTITELLKRLGWKEP